MRVFITLLLVYTIQQTALLKAQTSELEFASVQMESVSEEISSFDNEASIVINEINFSSSSAHDTKDWLELVNNGSSTIDLEGWSITDAERDSGYIFPAGLYFPPGEYLVICRDLSDFRAINSSPDINALGNMPFGLSSTGEALRLYDSELNVIDAVDYITQTPWPTGADSTGLTMELKDPSLENMDGSNWKAETFGGTPGAPNTGVNAISQPGIEEIADFKCFPNPFSDFTTIEFSVEKEDNYELAIYDMKGGLVKKIYNNYLAPGTYTVDWLGTDNNGNQLPGGIYHLRLSTLNKIATKKIILLK